MYLLFHYLTLVVLLVFGTFLSVFFGRMDVLRSMVGFTLAFIQLILSQTNMTMLNSFAFIFIFLAIPISSTAHT